MKKVFVQQWLLLSEMGSVCQVQIQEKAVCFSLLINVLGEGMNPVLFPPVIGK